MKNVQYKLNIPEDIYSELKKIAEANGITIAELLRQGIKWRIFVEDVYRDNGHLTVKRGEEEKELLVV